MATKNPPLNAVTFRRLTREQGLSLRALSRRCADLGTAVQHANISSYLRRRHNPSPATVLVLAKALGCHPADLVSRENAD